MPFSIRSAALIALQVVIGIVVVVIVYMLSLWILRRDELVSDVNTSRPVKDGVQVIDGYAIMSMLTDRSWSTVNQDALSFKPLRRSYNRKGGAQFSYSFWLQIRDTSAANVAHKTILLRGDKHPYWWTRKKSVAIDGRGGKSVDKTLIGPDAMIKCPRIRFGPTFDSLVVEFNTLANPDGRFEISPDAADDMDPGLRRNALKLMQNKWALLTFTFEDNTAISEFEDGIIVRFFINDILYRSHRQKGAFRQNNGDVHAMPTRSGGGDPGDGNIRDALIGNLSYYNYAMSPRDVVDVYNKGPPRHASKDVGVKSNGEPLYLSEYNKLDIYNTGATAQG